MISALFLLSYLYFLFSQCEIFGLKIVCPKPPLIQNWAELLIIHGGRRDRLLSLRYMYCASMKSFKSSTFNEKDSTGQ